MKPAEIKKALATATKAALPAAIKDAARWKAGDMVRAADAPECDDDSGEYPPVALASVPLAQPRITAGQAATMARRK